MNKILGKYLNKREQEFSATVEIPKVVIDRIKDTVLQSNVEVGGKFLGRIKKRSGNNTHMQIETFIDSGPGVDQSGAHIIPDAEYQEALFRVIETIDPDIDHIGSWHSHHCNQLDHLSPRDIQGYTESVNDHRYNSDFFFVMLIVGVRNYSIRARFYLFIRGEDYYTEVASSEVKEIQHVYILEKLVMEAEKAVKQNVLRPDREILGLQRPNKKGKVAPVEEDRGKKRGKQARDIQGKCHTTEELPLDTLQRIRAEDMRWFKKNLPNAKTVYNQRSNSIIWILTDETSEGVFKIRYEYPPQSREVLEAHLKFLFNGKIISDDKLILDESRFHIIKKCFDDMRHRAIHFVEEKSTATEEHRMFAKQPPLTKQK